LFENFVIIFIFNDGFSLLAPSSYKATKPLSVFLGGVGEALPRQKRAKLRS
jgi:hypothetical protein